tara:strand:+ start:965 stop:2536 length:1572 start_codon:yes stop_codon:yes gene_type:complete
MKINQRTIFILLIFNFLVRLIIILLTNLGNDEVYYVQYALNPDISHFDHPPLVGLLIRLSTFNLYFIHNDFFVRLGALIIGSLNLFIVYKIGAMLKDRVTGLISALLYSSSFYTSIIVGTFILPDTPLSLFWLLSILAFIYFISNPQKFRYAIIIFGLTVGFGLVSKYQAIFLWVGATLYFLIYNRQTLFTSKFWISIGLTLIIFSPILYWNFTSDYSGINYHSERVGNKSWIPSFDYFFSEFFGQIFYHNPFNIVLIIIAFMQTFKQNIRSIDKKITFLLCCGLPLILLTLFMSLFNKTLPHWSGPAYFSLILITGYSCTSLENSMPKKSLRNIMVSGVFFFYLIVGSALFQIKTGFFSSSNRSEVEKIGRSDFTVDIGLWKKIANEIALKIDRDKLSNSSDCSNNYIFTHNWFPAAHIDYYYALPNNIKLFVTGNYKKQHEYIKINKLRGRIPLHSNVYYISTSNYYQAPEQTLVDKFENIETVEIIPIQIKNKTIVNLFIWKLIDLKEDINLHTTKDKIN